MKTVISNTQRKAAKKLSLNKETVRLLQSGQQAQGQGFVSAGCRDTNEC